MNHPSSTALNTFLLRLLIHCVVGIYLHGLFYIRFQLLQDKNQVLFISISPAPSMVLRKQWVLDKGLLIGRRKESVSQRRTERAYGERKLESGTLTKRNSVILLTMEKVILCSHNVMFSLQLIGKVPRIAYWIESWEEAEWRMGRDDCRWWVLEWCFSHPRCFIGCNNESKLN